MSDHNDIAKAVPSGVIRKFERTSPRFHYRIRVIEAWHKESVELVQQAEAVNVLLEKAPGRLFRKVLSDEIEGSRVEELFRNVRDQIQALVLSVSELADVAGMKDDLIGRRGPRRSTHAPRANKGPTDALRPNLGDTHASDDQAA